MERSWAARRLGLVGSPHLMRGLYRLVDLREEPLGEPVQLRLSRLIGADLDERVVPALRPRAYRDLPDAAAVHPPPRRLLGRYEPRAEKRLRLRQDQVGTQGRTMEVPHGPFPSDHPTIRRRHVAHAGVKRRNVRELRTTEKLDHAIAALARIGESSTPRNGYNAPAAIGMPRTL